MNKHEHNPNLTRDERRALEVKRKAARLIRKEYNRRRYERQYARRSPGATEPEKTKARALVVEMQEILDEMDRKLGPAPRAKVAS